mmetsp:Transcript_28924/g.93250  ORF Transcript_28924/g.93250 Transcript_28924/m.93250 type:complete len:1062 (-) Transcript_28924:320-3505(-)
MHATENNTNDDEEAPSSPPETSDTEKMSSKSVVWRRRRVPAHLPFSRSLTRCRVCKRAKQGAVFCRVVRRHREDGWTPPSGFEKWIAEWEQTNEADQENSDTEELSSSRLLGSRLASGEQTTKGFYDDTPTTSGRSERRKRARLPALLDDEEARAAYLARKRPTRVWEKSGDNKSTAFEAFLDRNAHVDEDVALAALYKNAFDEAKAEAALPDKWVAVADEEDGDLALPRENNATSTTTLTTTRKRKAGLGGGLVGEQDDEKVPAALGGQVNNNDTDDLDTLQIASEAILSASTWLAGDDVTPVEVDVNEGAFPRMTAYSREGVPPRRRCDALTQEDLTKFGEALLEADRDCRLALKKAKRKLDVQTMADMLEVYYGRFKSSPSYEAWKTKLSKRREDEDRGGGAESRATSGKGAVTTSFKTTTTAKTTMTGVKGNNGGKKGLHFQSQRSTNNSSQFSFDFDPVLDSHLGDVFDCPCGCGRVVDNRGRAASHRRKWATRACRDRAAKEAAEGGSSVPSTPVLLKAASSSVTDDDQTNAANGSSAAAAAAGGGSKVRAFLVHAGVFVAAKRKGGWRCGEVLGRFKDDDRWRVKFVDDQDDDGSTNDGDGQQKKRNTGVEVTLDAAAVADLVLLDNNEALHSKDSKTTSTTTPGGEKRYRGVTCKKYGEQSRYNAAFSLLGDRFSLGGFDTADQAAAAWDVVAWRAGRDDLNTLDLGPPPPSPTKDDLKKLAKKLRDNVRIRGLNHSQLARAGLDVDAVDLGTRKVVFRAVNPSTPPPTPSRTTTTNTTKDDDPKPTTAYQEKKDKESNDKETHLPDAADDDGDGGERKNTKGTSSSPVNAPLGLVDDDAEMATSGSPGKTKALPKIGDALFSDCFKTSTGAALLLHGVVYVVSARLSRRWLVERFDRGDDAPDAPPLFEEISAADLHRAGTKSFGLLSRGLLDGDDKTKDKTSSKTLSSVLAFLSAELVGRAMLDGDKKLKPAQRERVITDLRLRRDFGVVVARTRPLHRLHQNNNPPGESSDQIPGPGPGTGTTGHPQDDDDVDYDLEAARKAIDRYASPA